MPPDDRRDSPDRRDESLAVEIGRLGEIVQDARKDIADVRADLTDALKGLDNRVTALELVRVRALEDWRLSEKVLSTERTRVAEATAAAAAATAEEAAEQAAENRRTQLSAKQFVLGLAVTSVITIVGALIASGHVF